MSIAERAVSADTIVSGIVRGIEVDQVDWLSLRESYQKAHAK